MIYNYITALVQYGLEHGLITEEDRCFAVNSLLKSLRLDDYEEAFGVSGASLEDILGALCDYACEKGIIEDSIVYRDLFDTELMGCLTPRPSQVSAAFWQDYGVSAELATDNYYRFSGDTNYIRRDRVSRDIKWKTETEYGLLDITINLSKPEKDPKAIAAAKLAKQSSYPKCQLCMENVGYAGRVNHPARENHRIITVDICGGQWGFQYSPYVYYNEHCIVFNYEHTPMVIDKSAFDKLFDFVRQFPHYFVGSNADLPIVGGSILSHEHFQGGRYDFTMAKAPIEKNYTVKGYDDVLVGRVKWPMSVIRLSGENTDRITELAAVILEKWRGYTDENAFIFAETEGEPHNTITPIARKNGRIYELDLVLRNNITTAEHPLGVYHPHAELHHIKKENIGLIEAMGLAVLPSRLKGEMERLAQVLVNDGIGAVRSDPILEKHADWAEEFASRTEITSDNVLDVIRNEIGKVFMQVLEHAGVYKRNSEGMAAFDRFVDTLN
ncbi:MAG: UDP-glucose--hexose-1-phosphate uridylyltransferase [Oscillospiraceae bacterium]|nr:UDP-glucose--hexose-1-phosphate uridylyltransferase [Oscillospiraceae bacterium]